MNLHLGSRVRAMTALIFAAGLASLTAPGAVTATGVDAASCVYYEVPYKQEAAVSAGAGEQQCLPAAEAAAVAEAAAWPDFDPSDMTAEVAAYEAQLEAATWPDFDPSDMTAEIAAYEAQQEAATWPDFDSTALDGSSTDIADTSPRMTQIAAEQEGSIDASDTASSYDAPFAEYAGQVVF